MNKESKKFETWEEVIVDFFGRKYEAEEEKYLKDELKSVGELYKKEKLFDDDEVEYLFDTRKNKKGNEESSISFQRRRAVQVLALTNKPEGLSLYKKKKGYVKKVKSLIKKYDPKIWLSVNSNNASSVSFATHVIKLTHSKIDTPSLFDCIDESNSAYLTTSALTTKAIDGAVAGNQFSPIFQFLELELNGIKLAERLSIDCRLFEGFVQGDEEAEELLKKWTQGFNKSLDGGKPSTHSLAKQVYFPLDSTKDCKDKKNYCLLCNVISSSLAHAIYEKIFDGSQKLVKKAQEKGKFLHEKSFTFTQRSYLNVTASNHSNASQLNGKRGGKLHLFSTQPPTWQSQIKPPSYRKSLFADFYSLAIKTEVNYLRDFLLRFSKLDLSIKDPKRKCHLERWVNTVIDEFLFFIGTIQNQPSGWSENEDIKLKKTHQYLLDPYRDDEAFQSVRKSTNWQAAIREDFAQWLNRQLRGKDRQFTPQKEHTRLWKKLLETPLREFMEPIEQEIKQHLKEVV